MSSGATQDKLRRLASCNVVVYVLCKALRMIYFIFCIGWKIEPEERPTFSQIHKDLSRSRGNDCGKS